MPKLSYRKRLEIQVAGAVLDVFRHAAKYLTQGIAAVNSAMPEEQKQVKKMFKLTEL